MNGDDKAGTKLEQEREKAWKMFYNIQDEW